MKITFDIDCTPEEARQFMGLPNIAPVQDNIMKDLEDKMREHLNTLDPETFVKTWMPGAAQGLADMQKTFWGQMGVNMPDAADK